MSSTPIDPRAVAELRARVMEAENRAAEADRRMAEASAEADRRMAEASAEADRRVAEASAEADRLSAQVEALKDDLTELRSRLSEREEDIERAEASIQEMAVLRERYHTTEQRMEELLGAQRERAVELEALRSRQAKAERELHTARDLKKRHDEARSELRRTEGRLRKAERDLATIRGSRAWKLVDGYWRLAGRLRGNRSGSKPSTTGAVDESAPPKSGFGTGGDVAVDAQRATLSERLKTWIDHASRAPGPDVVLMFSGTTYIQERRANRPIRLTRVLLNEGCAVFFNYYRFRPDSLPVDDDPLLIQSPIDITGNLIGTVLHADYGSKRKVLFASFPHEMMVRVAATAAQAGWSVIYDARDDWEEFAREGAARWYEPAYEQYMCRIADVVTAVSLPLAKKMEVLGGRDVYLSPNGLDPSFPRPVRERRPVRPVVGYFGHLTDKWFDWALVIKAAKSHPHIQFELAGHQAPNISLPENVRLLGLLTHAEIAEHSANWSGGIIPFKIGPLSDSVDPIKVYEYLHLGLPVLATYFPQMRSYPAVEIVESHDDFIERLPEFHAGHIDWTSVDVWLRDNTWEKRIQSYRELLDNCSTDPLRILEVSP